MRSSSISVARSRSITTITQTEYSLFLVQCSDLFDIPLSISHRCSHLAPLPSSTWSSAGFSSLSTVVLASAELILQYYGASWSGQSPLLGAVWAYLGLALDWTSLKFHGCMGLRLRSCRPGRCPCLSVEELHNKAVATCQRSRTELKTPIMPPLLLITFYSEYPQSSFLASLQIVLYIFIF
jgi:hypothetical protein